MRLRKIASVMAGAAALALVVSGCGSSEPTTPASSIASAASSVASAGQSVASAAQSAASSAVSSARSEVAGAVSSAVSGAVEDSQVLTSAEDGTLIVGIKFDQPGLGLKNPDGTFSGFDVEVAKYVADQLGVPADGIEFKEAKSAEREGLIERGEVDYIVATYSITDTRKEKVNFAGPYFIAAQDLLVKSDNTDITGPESMAGKILCSVTGSTSAQKVKDTYAADVALQEYGTYTECVEALRSGAVDAVTTDNVILAGYAAQYPGELKVVGQGFSIENYGIGLKKGDVAGTARINAAISSMIGDGRWRQALEDTVGPSGFTIPEPPTPSS
jgi:glutamate transport system substrate-binding protein